MLYIDRMYQFKTSHIKTQPLINYLISWTIEVQYAIINGCCRTLKIYYFIVLFQIRYKISFNNNHLNVHQLRAPQHRNTKKISSPAGFEPAHAERI
jgi:hypothetical protein